MNANGKHLLVAILLAAAAVLAGCSSGNDASTTANHTATALPTGAGATATSAPRTPAGTAAPAATPPTATVTPPVRAQDRDQIQQVVQDYLGALLQQRDQDRLRQYLRTGVSDAQLQQARDQIRAHTYHLVAITDITVTGDRATATVRLQDRDGTEVTRTLELERDQDQWRIRDPVLGGS
jgi:hypothetical protein